MIRSLAISPDGKRYAFMRSQADRQFFGVINIEAGKMVGGIDATE